MIRIEPGQHPHIHWVELKNNGVMTECAILKTDDFGNTYYIEVPGLDGIDKKRLQRIISNRNATNFELWDLMSQITLNNGVNALEYFHQLVKIITPQGVIMNPRAGTVGTGTVNTNSNEERGMAENMATQQVQADPPAPTPSADPAPTARKAPAKKKVAVKKAATK